MGKLRLATRPYPTKQSQQRSPPSSAPSPASHPPHPPPASPLPPPSHPHSKDALADHLLLRINHADAGTVRWLPSHSKLGRLAVLPPHRTGLGAGRALVAALHEHVARRRGREAVEIEGRPGEVLLVANAQAHAVGFYVKQGYEVEGDAFEEVSFLGGAGLGRVARVLTQVAGWRGAGTGWAGACADGQGDQVGAETELRGTMPTTEARTNRSLATRDGRTFRTRASSLRWQAACFVASHRTTHQLGRP